MIETEYCVIETRTMPDGKLRHKTWQAVRDAEKAKRIAAARRSVITAKRLPNREVTIVKRERISGGIYE